MKSPEKPPTEQMRLNTLHALKILDSPPEQRFDRLTRLAKWVFDVPIAVLSLVDKDRQWFKSVQGLDVSETPREISFCGHAILNHDIMVIPDALSDERFANNPLVTQTPHIRFYAGAPLVMPNGEVMGTLCLIDNKPRSFSAEDRQRLQDLAKIAEQELYVLQLGAVDELTMLANRRGFMDQSMRLIALSRRHHKPVTLLYFDLDHFKDINDRFGHAEGDHAIRAFACVLREVFRDTDVIGRLGGDEFAVVSEIDQQDVSVILKRLEDVLATYNDHSKRGYKLMCSAGVASYDLGEEVTLDHLMERADGHMYKQKHLRRAQSVVN
jgi:diguanylate cyclase (GGDEF)-like protein